MRKEDMILVSIDDHFIEPPDMWKNHVPAKWQSDVPKVVRNADGVDQWVFQGQATSTPFGMAATVGWPSEQWGFNPGSYSELRPGCFDVHERVRDMNANGVLASMNFPTMAGWNARTFAEGDDKELGLVMLRGYNDWVLDEWCAAYPGRFIPLGLVPMWDVELAAEEIHRIGRKGCRSVSFLETPHVQGYPSFLSGYWDPMLKALCEENMVLSLHIGAGFDVIRRPAEASVDHLMVLACQISAITAQDLLFGPTLRRFPELKVALSEGGIGWIPFYFDRIDRHYSNQTWLHHDDGFGGKKPSEVFREHILACYITDPSGLELRHRIGVDNIAWECDYPHTDTTWPESPESAWKEFEDAGCTDAEIHKMTWENACRFFDWDPFAHTPREQATVGALRALAADVDTTRMSKEEWKRRNEAAGIGVFQEGTADMS
ncbi:amidohydrolase family protein [Actinomadura sp. LOL_016]|uniref:amidohydrolase family protein n=1 Tax=unclassified Actinomadura TaxID=2626254 RepID=UPI003A8105FC